VYSVSAWGAFVGLFIARISRGRTIREVAFYSFVAPLVYAFLWFCTFGGIGLRQARQADELEALGGVYFNDTGYISTTRVIFFNQEVNTAMMSHKKMSSLMEQLSSPTSSLV